MKSFTRWLWLEKRGEHTLARLPIRRVKDMPHQRDRFHPDELQLLITTARKSPKIIEGMTGIERSWLYLLASVTGYRRLELANISRESFDLDNDPATLTVLAAYSKNREYACQPLPANIVPALREWISDRTGHVFPMLAGRKTYKMIATDMKDAGIVRRTDRGKRDFHALRNTFISALGDDKGLSPKEIQLLARHSDIRLTITGYMMPGRDLSKRAAAALPVLSVE